MPCYVTEELLFRLNLGRYFDQDRKDLTRIVHMFTVFTRGLDIFIQPSVFLFLLDTFPRFLISYFYPQKRELVIYKTYIKVSFYLSIIPPQLRACLITSESSKSACLFASNCRSFVPTSLRQRLRRGPRRFDAIYGLLSGYDSIPYFAAREPLIVPPTVNAPGHH